MKHFFRALQYFRPDKGRVGLVFLLLLGGTGVNLLKPWPLAIIVDSVLGQKPMPAWLQEWRPEAGAGFWLAMLGGIILLLHTAHGALTASQNYLSIRVSLCGLMRVRNEVFTRLERLSLRFHQGAAMGDTIYRAAWDTYSFQTLFQQGFIAFITSIVSLLMMVVVMWRLNVPLTLVCVTVVFLLAISIRLFGKKMRDRGVAAQQADSRVTSQVQRAIAALPLIQSYVREEEEGEKFRRQTATAQERRLSQHGWELLYWLGIALVFGAGTAAVVWLGARQVLNQNLTVGQLLVFISYLTQLYEPLNQLSHVGATVSTATAGTQRVFEILDTPEEVRESPHARPISRAAVDASPEPALPGAPPLQLRGAITFDRVSVRYPSRDCPALDNVSLSLPARQSLAIVGPSGSGKSTLLNLLPRFFDPDSGSVSIDGVDVKELRLKDLRAHIGLVLQSPLLLPVSVAENIAYGKPDASRQKIEAAARAAHAHDFIIRLPGGYDTRVGEGAQYLSVGESQRINLARAFLKDAPILLLDEPTSALDAESEALILESLVRLMHNRTTLMVAHHFITIRQVNKIAVLEDGRLTAFGTEGELRERGGYFARLFRAHETMGGAPSTSPQ